MLGLVKQLQMTGKGGAYIGDKLFVMTKKYFSKISSKADCKMCLRDFTILNSCKIK